MKSTPEYSQPEFFGGYKARETQLEHITKQSSQITESRIDRIGALIVGCQARQSRLAEELGQLNTESVPRQRFLKDQIDLCQRWVAWSGRDLDRLKRQLSETDSMSIESRPSQDRQE